MKYRINTIPLDPPHRNQFVLHASGYFGDMDYSYELEESAEEFITDDVEYLVAGYDMLRKLNDNRQLRRNLRDPNHPLRAHPGRDLISTDPQGERYPTIESYSLVYYDSSGTAFNVEVE